MHVFDTMHRVRLVLAVASVCRACRCRASEAVGGELESEASAAPRKACVAPLCQATRR
jgi:hypothetical protein